jgi:AraC family transcriptional regulator, transcriptional activator of the genes for pyochelin and ferripyochelin receptors
MVSLRMSSFTYGPIIPQPVVPDEFSSYLIPGSAAVSAEGAYGKILLQQIQAGEITMVYAVFRVDEDLALDFQCAPGSLQAHVALKNDSHYYVRDIGNLYLAEGQFNIVDAAQLEGTYFLEHGREYRSLHFVFSASYLDRLLPVFHYLEEWLASETSQPRLLFTVHSWLSEQMKNIIDSILQCTYQEEMQQFYRELKAKEFLCLSLMPGSREITPSVRLTRRNIALIHESKHVLDNNFDQHITIGSVAQQVGMNEFRLKAGFKQVFGISMFDYLIKTRMQAARNLLLETDKPIKEIAALTGYATKQSFLNAFKKYFHDTPGSFRKN